MIVFLYVSLPLQCKQGLMIIFVSISHSLMQKTARGNTAINEIRSGYFQLAVQVDFITVS